MMNVNPNGLPSNYAPPKTGGVRKQEPLQEALLPPINIIDKAPDGDVTGNPPPNQGRHIKIFGVCFSLHGKTLYVDWGNGNGFSITRG
jgi:hypothetical protein